MIKISPPILFVISSVFIFLISGLVWYLILYQAIGFFSGLLIMGFLIFLVFWQNFLALRRNGELSGLKIKKQILVVSLIFTLGLCEIIWSVSFMPFSFFILGGIISVVFAAVLDIFEKYFKKSIVDNLKIKKILTKNIIAGVVLIIIFIFISPWLPPKAY